MDLKRSARTMDVSGSAERNHLYVLDFFRLLFAFYVLLSHTLSVIGVRNRLWVAVEFYFVLSGFLLAYSTVHNQRPFWSLIAARYFRFLPLNLTGGLLVLAVLPVDLLAFLRDIFCLNVWYGDDWNAPTWYLSVYLLCTFVCLGIIRYLRREYCRNLVFASIVVLSASVLLRHGIGPYGGEFWHGIPLRVLRGFCEMSIGVLAAGIPRATTSVRFPNMSVVGNLLLVAVCICPCFYNVYPRFWLPYVLLCAVAIVSVSLKPKQCGYLSEIGRKCSKYAFPLFCTHYFLIYWVQDWMRAHADASWLHRGVVGFMTVLIGFGVAVLAHSFVQRPYDGLIRRLVDSRQKRMLA